MEQRVAHGAAHVDRDVALRLRGRRADVRREHHVRRAANRMIGGQWLALVHVEHRAVQLPALERGQQRLVIDDAAARQVRPRCAPRVAATARVAQSVPSSRR